MDVLPYKKMVFSNEDFLIQFPNLLLRFMNANIGKQISDTQDSIGWCIIIRVLIELDLQKPIARRRIINIQWNKSCVPFTYKKLPRLCFKCGNEVCDIDDALAKNSNRQYGIWLQVGGGRQPNINTSHRAASFGCSGDTPKSTLGGDYTKRGH